MASPYHPEYDGYYSMSWHDNEENALKRWFDNFKVERYASFACETECLIVKEVPSERRRRKRYICEIEDEGRGTKREVVMDHTAPPAPLLTFAAKRRYVPPPPKTPAELRREAEWRRMEMLGYEPVYRARMPRISAAYFDPRQAIEDVMTIEYEIEWVPRRRDYYRMPEPARSKPAPVRHRRN